MIVRLNTVISVIVIFAVSILVLLWTQYLMGYYSSARPWQECRRRIAKKHRVTYFINRFLTNFAVPASLVTMVAASVVFARLNAGSDNDLISPTMIGTQKTFDDLFSQDKVDTQPAERQETRLSMLHIPEDFAERPIDGQMYDYFYTELSTVYSDGSLPAYDPPPEISLSLSEDMYEDPSLKEAKEYLDKYNASPLQGYLYQYGRSLSDFKGTSVSVTYDQILEISSQSFGSLESFLKYADHRVGDSVVIDSHWVAFLEGKMLQRYGDILPGISGGEALSDYFMLMSYVSFEIGLEKVDESSRDYAILAYYTGSSGLKLMGRIDSGSELYHRVAAQALSCYEKAGTCYLKRPDFYRSEPGIRARIDVDITTLKGLTDN